MNTLDFLSNVLRDYCTLHDLEYMSADDLLYESDTEEDHDRLHDVNYLTINWGLN